MEIEEIELALHCSGSVVLLVQERGGGTWQLELTLGAGRIMMVTVPKILPSASELPGTDIRAIFTWLSLDPGTMRFK